MIGHEPRGHRDHQTKSTLHDARRSALQQQTFPTLYPLKGSKVGVGMPVVLTFDVPVKNSKEFEKNLHVTSSPKQAGSWRWFSDTEVRFRPKNYWKPGTKVTAYGRPSTASTPATGSTARTRPAPPSRSAAR